MGVLVYAEYQVPLAQGGTSTFAFSVEPPGRDGLAKPPNCAALETHGLVTLIDYPTGPTHPITWWKMQDTVTVTASDLDEPLADDLKAEIARYLTLFLADVAPIMSELSGR
jgi:hypothetical protein